MLFAPVFAAIVCIPAAVLFAKRDRSIAFFIGLVALAVFFGVTQILTGAAESYCAALVVPAALAGALLLVVVAGLYRRAQRGI